MANEFRDRVLDPDFEGRKIVLYEYSFPDKVELRAFHGGKLEYTMELNDSLPSIIDEGLLRIKQIITDSQIK